jgi:hypothetical protein
MIVKVWNQVCTATERGYHAVIMNQKETTAVFFPNR